MAAELAVIDHLRVAVRVAGVDVTKALAASPAAVAKDDQLGTLALAFVR